VVADDVAGGDVGEHRDGDAPFAVLRRGDHRGGGRAAFRDDVDDEFDRWPDQNGTREHRVHRAHRLLGEALGRGDDRLGQHLGALHDLTLVRADDAGLADELVGAIRLHVEQVDQPSTVH
jgi:hypothetical protein